MVKPIALPMMTLTKFFEFLAMTPRTWGLTRRGAVRSTCVTNLPRCPIEAVADLTGDAFELAVRLRLPVVEAQKVVAAADNNPHADSQVRQQLLEACGLA